MTANLVAADWIKRIADEERKRDAVRAREEEIADRKTRLVRLNGQRLVEDLRATVIRDIDAFRAEFPGGRTPHIVLETTESQPGFVVLNQAPAGVSLAVMPNLANATIKCRYRFTTTNGLPPREETVELVFTGAGEDALQIRHSGTGQLYPTADALSEFLLVPVFTGRPR